MHKAVVDDHLGEPLLKFNDLESLLCGYPGDLFGNYAEKYNLFMNLRNSLDYPYARIFVNYDLLKQDSTELNKKMVAEYLFDQKTGKPFGKSGIGDIYDHQFPILKNYSFKQVGVYKIRLNQFMRMDTIPGILAVGLRVERAEK